MSDAVDAVKRAALDLSPAEWRAVVRDVNAEFSRRAEAARAEEARALAPGMDMTPEGYVREFAARGRENLYPLPAWEKAYQDAGIIERAERMGYVRIGRGHSAPVSLTEEGRRSYRRTTNLRRTDRPSRCERGPLPSSRCRAGADQACTFSVALKSYALPSSVTSNLQSPMTPSLSVPLAVMVSPGATRPRYTQGCAASMRITKVSA